MPTIPRIVYFAQTVQIGSPTAGTGLFPISSANIEVTRPIEAITTFGKFSSLNTAQTNLTTVKGTLKGYLGSGYGGATGAAAISGGYVWSGFNTNFISGLITDTKASNQASITVSPGGFSMTGILTSLGIDISMGSFGMIDLGFAGIGNPVIVAPTGTFATDLNTGFALSPITTMSIGTGGGLSGAYATSIKFSLDLPTDTLSALGDNPNATQGNLTSQMATKPPYKATISVEGYGVDPTKNDTFFTGVYGIGEIGIALPNAKVSSRSVSNAPGQVSQTFSYTIEDVTATFTSVLLSGYSQYGSIQTGVTYGA